MRLKLIKLFPFFLFFTFLRIPVDGYDMFPDAVGFIGFLVTLFLLRKYDRLWRTGFFISAALLLLSAAPYLIRISELSLGTFYSCVFLYAGLQFALFRYVISGVSSVARKCHNHSLAYRTDQRRVDFTPYAFLTALGIALRFRYEIATILTIIIGAVFVAKLFPFFMSAGQELADRYVLANQPFSYVPLIKNPLDKKSDVEFYNRIASEYIKEPPKKKPDPNWRIGTKKLPRGWHSDDIPDWKPPEPPKRPIDITDEKSENRREA